MPANHLTLSCRRCNTSGFLKSKASSNGERLSFPMDVEEISAGFRGGHRDDGGWIIRCEQCELPARVEMAVGAAAI